MKKIFLFCVLAGFLFLNFNLAKASQPNTVEESITVVEKGIDAVIKELPGNLVKTFKEEAMPIWIKMYGWFYDRFGWKIEAWFKKDVAPEIEKRTPGLEEEFTKEKEEMKTDVPVAGKSLWEKFLEIIK